MGRQGARGRAVIGFVGVALLATVGFLATSCGRQWLHRVDSAVLGERGTDTWARVRGSEDWSGVEPLRPNQDYAWLAAAGAPVRIAHALGESDLPTANTLGAARRAYRAGLRVLEVDLVMEDGELRCQHDPGPQGDLVKDGCTFETLLTTVPGDAWILLDLKSDFEAAGEYVVNRIKGTADARRVVFQLYQPQDFSLFNRWQSKADLPGPVLTTYRVRRSVDHVALQAGRLGVAALAVPLDRLPALSVRPAGAVVLAHPVHDCTAWAEAMRRVDGVYTLSSLQCAHSFKVGSS
ncbi:hypothetical protein CDN99_18000 [Roseateles aquatilis]|uniref:GP-PDE domain-containing protein n=1 Tax=Roseateles aquatilis TaxID=431061 RepID=A0A246J4H8_9BURK|nr:hypothetical protein CDN99_18000 [Roseateles aquatilis]